MHNWTFITLDSGSVVTLNAWTTCPQYGEPVFRHPHWSRFSPLGLDAHFIIGTVMILVTTLAVIGNLFVLWVFCRNKYLRTPGNMLVNNLALSDSLMALTTFPLFIAASFCGHWPFGRKVCQIYGASSTFFGLMSMATSAAIAFDRYQVIASQRGPLKHTSRKQASILILFVWLYAFAWAVSPLLGWNEYILDGSDTSCSFNYLDRSANHTSLIISMCAGGFAAPLVVIILYYSKLYVRVKDHKRQFASLCNQMRAKVSEGRRKYKRRKVEFEIAKSMMISVFLYCLSWMPYAVIALVGQVGDRDILTPVVSTVPAIFAKASTVYNPFVYTLSHPRFRRKVPCARMRLKIACYVTSTEDGMSMSNSRTSNSGTPFSRRHADRRPVQLNKSYKNGSIPLRKLGESTKSSPEHPSSVIKLNDQFIRQVLAANRRNSHPDSTAPLVEQSDDQDPKNKLDNNNSTGDMVP